MLHYLREFPIIGFRIITEKYRLMIYQFSNRTELVALQRVVANGPVANAIVKGKEKRSLSLPSFLNEADVCVSMTLLFRAQFLAELVARPRRASLTTPMSDTSPAPEASSMLVPPSLLARCLTLVVIILPLAGVIAAPFLLWGWGFSWVDLGLMVGLYVLTGLGITVGYHRLFTHLSFETKPVVKFILAVFGSMAVQGSLMEWVATHRRHHQHSDTSDDPHSPHCHGRGVRAMLVGVWHSHMGWFFKRDSRNLMNYVQDLRKSKMMRVASALFPLWIVLTLLIPALLGGLLTLSWKGALSGFIWGGLVRIFLLHHVTWSVNSACHLWGRRFYRSHDMSRDNLVFGVLALGEGWHNSHHAFPSSARHGLRWWQVDLSYWFIRTLALLGLAWNLRIPSPAALAQKRNG